MYVQESINPFVLGIGILLITIFILFYVNSEESNITIFLPIFFLSILLHLLVIISYPQTFFEYDAHIGFQLTKIIMESGTTNIPSIYLDSWAIKNELPYPMLHFSSIIISLFTDLPLKYTVKWIPQFYGILSLTFYIMVCKYLFKDQKIVVYSALFFIFIYGNIIFQTTYVKQSLGFVLFLLSFYLILLKTDAKMSTGFVLLYLIVFMSLAYTHSLTSFFLLILLLILFTYQFINNILKKHLNSFKVTASNKILSNDFKTTIIMLFVLYVGYWMFNDFVIIEHIVSGLFTPSGHVSLFTFSCSPRYNIYIQLEKILLLSSVIVITYDIIKNKSDIFFKIVFLSWASVLSMFFFATKIQFYRVEIFVWPFLIFALISSLVKNVHGIVKINKKLLYPLLTLFVITNMFAISPYVYSQNYAPEYSHGEYRNYITEEEYYATNWLKSPGKIVGAEQFSVTFIEKEVNDQKLIKDVDILSGNFERLKNYKWIMFSDEYFNMIFDRNRPKNKLVNISDETYNGVFVNNHNFLYIYDNGHSKVLKIEVKVL